MDSPDQSDTMDTMPTETLWEILERRRNEQADLLASRLRLDGECRDELYDAIDRAMLAIIRDIRTQFGVLLIDRMDRTALEGILFQLAHSVGLTVNNVRGRESFSASMESTRNMLAGIAAGATVALRDPDEGKGAVAAFGHLLPQEPASEQAPR